MALSMSRPWSSVPSQAMLPSISAWRGARRPSISDRLARSYGFCGAKYGAKITRTTRMASAITEPRTVGRARSFFRMEARCGVSARGWTVRVRPGLGELAMADY